MVVPMITNSETVTYLIVTLSSRAKDKTTVTTERMTTLYIHIPISFESFRAGIFTCIRKQRLKIMGLMRGMKSQDILTLGAIPFEILRGRPNGKWTPLYILILRRSPYIHKTVKKTDNICLQNQECR